MSDGEDSETVTACPSCDSSTIYERATVEPPWRCGECGHEFAEPVERASRDPGVADRAPADEGSPTDGSAVASDLDEEIATLPEDTPDTGFAARAPGDKIALDKAEGQGYADPFVVCEILSRTEWIVPFATNWVDADVILTSGTPSGTAYRAVVDPDGTVRLYRPAGDERITAASKSVAEVGSVDPAGAVSRAAYAEHFASDPDASEPANPWRDIGREA